MAKFRKENDAYQANARQFMFEREELEREQANMDDARKAMQSQMERQKEMEINGAKQGFSDHFKTRVKQIREELEKKIQALETDKDKRSSQSHIMRLDSEPHQINAASTVWPQTSEF